MTRTPQIRLVTAAAATDVSANQTITDKTITAYLIKAAVVNVNVTVNVSPASSVHMPPNASTQGSTMADSVRARMCRHLWHAILLTQVDKVAAEVHVCVMKIWTGMDIALRATEVEECVILTVIVLPMNFVTRRSVDSVQTLCKTMGQSVRALMFGQGGCSRAIMS